MTRFSWQETGSYDYEAWSSSVKEAKKVSIFPPATSFPPFLRWDILLYPLIVTFWSFSHRELYRIYPKISLPKKSLFFNSKRRQRNVAGSEGGRSVNHVDTLNAGSASENCKARNSHKTQTQPTELLQTRLFIMMMMIPLTAHLNHPHRQPGLFGQLLPNVSRRFGRLRKGRFEHLQLLGLDGGPRASPLVAPAAVVQVNRGERRGLTGAGGTRTLLFPLRIIWEI